MTAILTAYRVLTACATPVLPLWLSRRADAGKEDPTRLDERFGRTDAPRPDGALVWLHGASLGESQVIRELIAIITEAHPQTSFLVTTQTRSAAGLWGRDLPARTRHLYAPADLPSAARRFIGHWQPDLAIFVESEIWPNLLYELQRADIPAALVNARMNDRSLAGWARRRRTAETVFGAFDIILAADATTRATLASVSDVEVVAMPNLKAAVPPLAVDEAAAHELRARFGTTPVICLASLHAEESHLLDALPGVARIVVPRHPDAFPDIGPDIDAPRRSTGALPTPGPSAYLFDTFGEMGTAMAASDIVIMGGSFHPALKGHNLMEALNLGKPVISGRHVDSFRGLYDAYWRQTQTRPVEIATLSQAVTDTAWRPDHQAFVDSLAGARQAVARALKPLLDASLGTSGANP